MKRKTKTKSKAKSISTTLKNCTFYALRFDEKAVNAIDSIAEGLIENAKGLGALAQVLKASNVSIECLLKIGDSEGQIKGIK